jgi:hypothetical protein
MGFFLEERSAVNPQPRKSISPQRSQRTQSRRRVLTKITPIFADYKAGILEGI